MVAKKQCKVFSADRRETNENCPRFVAMAQVDSLVEADDDLDSLIRLVIDQRHEYKEDVVIWYNLETVAAIITTAGRVLRLYVPPATEIAASERDYHRQRILAERQLRHDSD